MKKSILFAIFSLFAFFTFANCRAETINWYVGDNLYTTTSCETGGDINLPTTPTIPGQVFLGWRAYTPLEYIEIQGKQYIDTGITPNKNTVFRVKLNMQQVTGAKVIGCTSNDLSYNFFNYSEAIYFDYGDWKQNRISGSSFSNNTTYDFVVGAVYVKNYDTDTYLIGTKKDMDVTFACTIEIGNKDANTYGKIYLMQIWDNDTLLRDLIPVLDSDGVACMYDKVTNEFFYNQWDGNFIAGPIINQ